MAKRVVIRLYPNGHIEAKTSGIIGKSCMEMIGKVENLLDATIVKSAFTDEYYEKNVYLETDQQQVQEQKGQV